MHRLQSGRSVYWTSILGTTVHVRIAEDVPGLRAALRRAASPRRLRLKVVTDERTWANAPSSVISLR